MNNINRIRPLRRIARWALLLGLAYSAVVIIALVFENRLVYPSSVVSDYPTGQSDPAVRDLSLSTASGIEIHARYAERKGATGAILVSHGNGGNLGDQMGLVRELRDRFERSVLVYDYPGYGKSGGDPSETGCYEAGEAAHRWLVEQKIPANRILLFGQSLGGGVSIELAQRVESEALILVSTFETLPKAAKARFFFLPCEWLMANRYDSIAKLPNYRKPVFIVHGDRDATIPFVQGERLFEIANEPKRFRKIEGGTHNCPLGAEVIEEARQFFEKERKD